jgi:predicted transcriptional regulator
MKFGYTPVPNLLLKAQGKLKITPMQFNVLVQVVEHWWEAERDPYPAKDTIARRMNKSPRQVQRYLTELENAGMIRRIARYSGKKAQINNAYSFDGLIKKLKALEPEFTKEAEPSPQTLTGLHPALASRRPRLRAQNFSREKYRLPPLRLCPIAAHGDGNSRGHTSHNGRGPNKNQ